MLTAFLGHYSTRTWPDTCMRWPWYQAQPNSLKPSSQTASRTFPMPVSTGVSMEPTCITTALRCRPEYSIHVATCVSLGPWAEGSCRELTNYLCLQQQKKKRNLYC